MENKGRLFIGLEISLAIILACWALGYTLGAEYESLQSIISNAPTIGKPPPDFSLMDLSGKQIHLSDFIGKPIMINFWAAWCGPCVAEMPYFQELYNTYRDEFVLIAINSHDTERVINDFVNDHGLNFMIVMDPGGHILDRYQITAYPTTFFITAEGIIQDIKVGSMKRAELIEYIRGIGVGR
jgi:peroxiredoxin